MVGNYRSISQLSVFSKIIGKIVTNLLLQYTQQNSHFSNTQHGFRPKLSTETSFLQVFKQIYDTIDEKEICLLTLCHLSNHSIVSVMIFYFKKSTKLGTDNFWFENDLSNRTESVRIGNNLSSTLQVSLSWSATGIYVRTDPIHYLRE